MFFYAHGACSITYNYQIINFSGSPSNNTTLWGINNSGQSVGYYFNGPILNSFLYSNSQYTPLFTNTVGQFLVQGINNSGQLVGTYSPGDGTGIYGFHGTATNYSPLMYPDANVTAGYGINDIGQVVGYFYGGNYSGYSQGFLYSNNEYISINVPGAFSTEAYGINNNSQIVGYYNNETGSHGFIYQNGVYTTVDVPGSGATQLSGINNLGNVTGIFYNFIDHGYYPFVKIGDSYTILNLGVHDYTFPHGINDAGQIIGQYGQYGFIATPVPLPSTVLLLGSGLLGLAGWRRFRKG